MGAGRTWQERRLSCPRWRRLLRRGWSQDVTLGRLSDAQMLSLLRSGRGDSSPVIRTCVRRFWCLRCQEGPSSSACRRTRQQPSSGTNKLRTLPFHAGFGTSDAQLQARGSGDRRTPIPPVASQPRQAAVAMGCQPCTGCPIRGALPRRRALGPPGGVRAASADSAPSPQGGEAACGRSPSSLKQWSPPCLYPSESGSASAQHAQSRRSRNWAQPGPQGSPRIQGDRRPGSSRRPLVLSASSCHPDWRRTGPGVPTAARRRPTRYTACLWTTRP